MALVGLRTALVALRMALVGLREQPLSRTRRGCQPLLAALFSKFFLCYIRFPAFIPRRR